MFNLIVSASLRSRLFVLLAALFLIVYGYHALPRVPVDVFPDLTRPIVTVMSEAEGLAPQEVEAQVSAPLEAALSGIANVGRVRSVSSVGLSLVYAEFEWGTDVARNRQLVAERIGRVRERLPRGVLPPRPENTLSRAELIPASGARSAVPCLPSTRRGPRPWFRAAVCAERGRD